MSSIVGKVWDTGAGEDGQESDRAGSEGVPCPGEVLCLLIINSSVAIITNCG